MYYLVEFVMHGSENINIIGLFAGIENSQDARIHALCCIYCLAANWYPQRDSQAGHIRGDYYQETDCEYRTNTSCFLSLCLKLSIMINVLICYGETNDMLQ